MRNNEVRLKCGLRAGKKEGVWGRNFCLPDLSSSKFSTRPNPRRPKGGGRRGLKLPGKLGLSFSGVFFKISPNLPVKAAPNVKFHFIGIVLPRILQLASHFLPRDPEVRLRGAQSSAIERNTGLWNRNTKAEQPIFCLSPLVKAPNFHSDGGGKRKRQFFRSSAHAKGRSWAVERFAQKR